MTEEKKKEISQNPTQNHYPDEGTQQAILEKIRMPLLSLVDATAQYILHQPSKEEALLAVQKKDWFTVSKFEDQKGVYVQLMKSNQCEELKNYLDYQFFPSKIPFYTGNTFYQSEMTTLFDAYHALYIEQAKSGLPVPNNKDQVLNIICKAQQQAIEAGLSCNLLLHPDVHPSKNSAFCKSLKRGCAHDTSILLEKMEISFACNLLFSENDKNSSLPPIIVARNTDKAEPGTYTFSHLNDEKVKSMGLNAYLMDMIKNYKPSEEDISRLTAVKERLRQRYPYTFSDLDMQGGFYPQEKTEVLAARFDERLSNIRTYMTRELSPEEQQPIEQLDSYIKQLHQTDPELLNNFTKLKTPIVVLTSPIPYSYTTPTYVTYDKEITFDRFKDMLHQAVNCNTRDGKQQEMPHEVAKRQVQPPSQQHTNNG